MKKKIFWLIFIYLLIVFQIGFFRSFSISVPNFALVTIFSLIVFRKTGDHFSPLLALWGGFLFDIFFYPGFGIGTLSLPIAAMILGKSRHWIPQNKLRWFIAKLILFLAVYYIGSNGISLVLDSFFVQNMKIPLVSQGYSFYSIIGNLLFGGIIFIGRRQWRKIAR
jgi:cell shape-determining protein MreD